MASKRAKFGAGYQHFLGVQERGNALSQTNAGNTRKPRENLSFEQPFRLESQQAPKCPHGHNQFTTQTGFAEIDRKVS